MLPAIYTIFWITLLTLFYCYAGYGILAGILASVRNFFKRKIPAAAGKEWLPVTLVVTAYNESAILEQKIQNSLAIDYPRELFRILFITDGSTDGSEKIVQQHSSLLSLHQPDRKGKYAAIKRAMKHVDTPLVVFSDANTLLNPECIRRIAVHYEKENVGAVAGEKKILRQANTSAVGAAEGLYWEYESYLKKLDAGLNTVTGAAGELFSIRTRLFRELDDELILDDFIISMQICLEGYKIEYEPGAFAMELPSLSLAEEAKRKVRISAGAYQSIRYLKGCLNIFKHPLLAFQYISRRFFRWVFCPPFLLLLLVSNAWLFFREGTPLFYSLSFYAQLIFYACALLGWLLIRSGKKAWLFTIPFYFVFMNYCLVKGFFKFLRGKQSVLWEKSKRQIAVP